jgi:hypothetical protein
MRHACFSRGGLLLGCSHYLTYGAELDGDIALHLFGNASAGALFRCVRKPYLISFVVRSPPPGVGAILRRVRGRSRDHRRQAHRCLGLLAGAATSESCVAGLFEFWRPRPARVTGTGFRLHETTEPEA